VNKDAFRALDIPRVPSHEGQAKRPEQIPQTTNELTRDLVKVELTKRLECAIATPATTITTREAAQLLRALGQEDRGARVEAAPVELPDWKLLSPEELEQVRVARDTLAADPHDVKAAMTMGALHGKALALSRAAKTEPST